MGTTGGNSSPSMGTDQIGQAMKIVTHVLRSAGEKSVAGNQQLTETVMKQASENVTQLLEIVKTMAAAKDPMEIATLYSAFLIRSTQTHSQQLVEVGSLMGQTSKEAWAPIGAAISMAAKGTMNRD